MTFAIWALIAGAIFTVMALSGTLLKRLPLSTSMLYLLAGLVMGPSFFALLNPSPITDHHVLEVITEAAVLVSLFAVGLKLSLPWSDWRWRGAAARNAVDGRHDYAADSDRNAVVRSAARCGDPSRSHPAPTDPVLASDVQLEDPDDRDSVRFSLTGEGGLE